MWYHKTMQRFGCTYCNQIYITCICVCIYIYTYVYIFTQVYTSIPAWTLQLYSHACVFRVETCNGSSITLTSPTTLLYELVVAGGFPFKYFLMKYPPSYWIGIFPSGKRWHNYGNSLCFMDKSTISMAMFNSFLQVYQRVSCRFFPGEPAAASLKPGVHGAQAPLLRTCEAPERGLCQLVRASAWKCIASGKHTVKAIENGQRNSWFTHEKWWFSIVMSRFTRGYIPRSGADLKLEMNLGL